MTRPRLPLLRYLSSSISWRVDDLRRRRPGPGAADVLRLERSTHFRDDESRVRRRRCRLAARRSPSRPAEPIRWRHGPAPDVVVLGLPRGGVPVAFEVARALGVPLDVFVVRKLGVPGHEELAFGAVASGGLRVLNPEVAADLPPAVVAEVTAREQRELAAREAAYRGDRPPLDLAGRTVVLVDDGLATGASMRAAVAAVRQQGPAAVVVAVPVGAAADLRAARGRGRRGGVRRHARAVRGGGRLVRRLLPHHRRRGPPAAGRARPGLNGGAGQRAGGREMLVGCAIDASAPASSWSRRSASGRG